MSAKVVNVKVKHIRPAYADLEEWCSDPNNVYIGRAGVVFIPTADGRKARYPSTASKWHNPYKISETVTREMALEQYRGHLQEMLATGVDNLAEFKLLKGKTLNGD